MEKLNVFIVALPTFDSVVDRIKDAIEEKFEKPKPCSCFGKWFNEARDFTPKSLKVDEPCGNVQPWGVGGTPANENLRFGYQGPCIDEPMRSDYDCRWEFEDDHKAFDNYVTAAEDCIARGLEKKSNAPIHRCEAIRKRLNEAPPMNLPLIGETDWFDEDIEWEF